MSTSRLNCERQTAIMSWFTFWFSRPVLPQPCWSYFHSRRKYLRDRTSIRVPNGMLQWRIYKTITNYKLFTHGLKNKFFPSKEIKHQKRYICWGLFDTQDSRMREFIFHINNIVYYLENFPLFGLAQVITDIKIIDILMFALPRKWQK